MLRETHFLILHYEFDGNSVSGAIWLYALTQNLYLDLLGIRLLPLIRIAAAPTESRDSRRNPSLGYVAAVYWCCSFLMTTILLCEDSSWTGHKFVLCFLCLIGQDSDGGSVDTELIPLLFLDEHAGRLWTYGARGGEEGSRLPSLALSSCVYGRASRHADG
ncbi:hypothetical protein F5Y11DRAFT_156433 [Daldinia sp. FL1419]|nr:hypothetical protein F5Y11DRAFT_156433 [Daldinia sp. FL1419]